MAMYRVEVNNGEYNEVSYLEADSVEELIEKVRAVYDKKRYEIVEVSKIIKRDWSKV